MSTATPSPAAEAVTGQKPLPVVRLSITGVFMGLANLVPGVSGGTMVLALGLYDEFIGAVSTLTRLRISLRPVLILAFLFGISLATIVLLSTVMQFLMEMFLPGMLGLFIGMTLGGAPIIVRRMKPFTPVAAATTAVGIACMAAIAFLLKPDTTSATFAHFFLGGIVGSAAMILPGISGSYLLLVLGLYLPIIGGISEMKDALRARDFEQLMSLTMGIAVPVGLGVVVGIVALSNLLKYLLDRFEIQTLGLLLGLLLGSVLGLYPFQQVALDKLPRYAVAAEGARELRVVGFGWEQSQEFRTWRNLSALEARDLRVRVLDARADATPTVADVERARSQGAIIVTYDVNVPRDVRRAAHDKRQGEVQLIIIPNAEFTWPKAALVLTLIVAGFFTTFTLARLGTRKPASTAT